MSNSEFKVFVIEKSRQLRVWARLVDDGVPQRYRTNTAILTKLEETSRIKNQVITMPDGTAIRIRKGHYFFHKKVNGEISLVST